MNNFLNNLFNKYSYNIILAVNSFFSSLYCHLSMSVKGIKYANNSRFWGITRFYRTNKSSIIIGENSSFRSGAVSNLIGINRPCIISTNRPGAQITIGNNCGFSGTVIGAFNSITLENNVRCGANTLITDSDWHMDDYRSGEPKAIIIGRNVWLGEGVKVLKGISIGENSVIGAGSIVTKNIPANVIAAGNPCRVIKEFKKEYST